MKIIVDAMGGDHAPQAVIEGCVNAYCEFNRKITLVGPEDVIKQEIAKYDVSEDAFEIVHAPEVISNNEAPVAAIKQKNDSSIVKGLEMVREDCNNIFISAGSTGAVLAGAVLKVGRVKGIKRPALAPFMPNLKDGALLIDCGANVDCKVENLVDFALLGSVYMEKVMGRSNPKVGLVNNGVEEKKGNQLVKEAHQALKHDGRFNFYGNVESRDVPNGDVDVLVCDGFTGNVVLKLTEGVVMSTFSMLKDVFYASFLTKLAALILKPGLKKLKKKLDASEVGGAPLLGINGGVIKAHGNSDAKGIKSSIRQAILYADNGVLEAIKQKLK